MSKEAYYFSHDSNARNDLKIIKLRRQLGLEGLGCFWCIIEMLRESTGYKLPMTAIDDIAFDLNISTEKVKTIVTTYDLFAIEENTFFSARLLKSMEIYESQKKRLSEGGKRGSAKRYGKTEDKQNPNSFI